MTSAIYFDGRSAHLHQVELETHGDTIAIRGAAVDRTYAAAETTLSEPFEHAPAVLYLPDGARCEVSGPARAELANALGYRKPRAVRWQEHWRAAVAAVALLAGLVVATALWGVPAAAEFIAARLPADVDKTLGQSALAGLESQGVLLPTRFSDERVAEMEQVLRQVLPAQPRVPIRLLARASDELGPNALALPDGTIVVTDDMVKLILDGQQDFGEVEVAQLAGVLAHEIGHIERRHTARVLARTSLTGALSAALFGDFSAVAAGVPAVLMNMHYSREMENEADQYAIRALQQKGLPLDPLADLFEALDETPQAEQRRGLPRWLSESMDYTSSHPPTHQRIERLRGVGPQ